MVIDISFVFAAMLLSSSNALNTSFAQTNNDVGDNNSNRQNFVDFENCVEEEAGTTGFATEQQIRDCFAPIYITANNDNNDNNDN
ncbi:hypothetical protein BH23THE1_BH23THE1_21340 [soil metagenome]